MAKKPNLLKKYFLYLLLTMFWLLYPGKNELLIKANLNPRAFIKIEPLRFKPQPLPKTNNYLEKSQLMAQSYLVMDLNSFTPIASYRPNKRMYPASLVKLATALVSYQKYPLDKTLTVKKVIDQELKIGLVKNEKISALNLLYGILVYSGNDAAYTLAENYPGGVTEFVKQMNKLSQTLQLKNTRFTNPIGFDHPNQYTNALDLAFLSREFLKNKMLLNIASTKSITVSDVSFENFHNLNSVNQLLGEIPHLGGLKTGTTDQAGQNLIAFYEFKKKPVLIVLLKSEDRFNDARLLINYVNHHLNYLEIT